MTEAEQEKRCMHCGKQAAFPFIRRCQRHQNIHELAVAYRTSAWINGRRATCQQDPNRNRDMVELFGKPE
jgi:hypothetical protein